ncbi:zinc ABC transporter ATP-binding protein [Gracilibacillus halophilus YIM-C55.5]|uniref:Zinc ABC transporter ATP-binding protein n=1 Tax=Gracilibacillus halophilus YIM-C55.5 TaxID=1308866 RepID=N4WCB0_9BACI|nr:metal ABC transporter ATP-binding protein [Gracilibacillus halophilus]ENH96884.1 zinc ABC transporter ATP-binding protein [Gracilibacillus halophilus YIM-C55.5]
MSEPKIVEVKNVSFRYEKEWAIEHVNFSIDKGQFLGLVGPNGSGKSTLIYLILGLIKPNKGSIRVFDESITHFNKWKEIGYVPQKANSFNTGFPASVLEVVKSGLVSRLGIFRFLKRKHTQKAIEALKIVDMEDFAKSNIGELSGGQQQRVFIARALVSDPSLLILDEPTVGVDTKHVTDLYDLLGRLNKKNGITLLMITHDIGTITEHATHVVSMNKTINFYGTSEDYNQYNAQGSLQWYREQSDQAFVTTHKEVTSDV